MKYIKENPMSIVELAKREKGLIGTFTDSKVAKMIICFKLNDFIDVRNRFVISILADTGLRVNELVSIRIDDIKEMTIKVLGKGRGKKNMSLFPLYLRKS